MPNGANQDAAGPSGLRSLPATDLSRLATLCAGVSRLFSYPQDSVPDAAPPPEAHPARPPPSLQALQVEYTRLFINSLPEVPCPPYGSVYLEGSCMAASTVSIGTAYRRAGVETDEMPDHIAVEMQFLAIALHAMSAGATDLHADVVEVIEHLTSWTPAFLERVSKHDRLGFYADAARIAGTVVAELARSAGCAFTAPTDASGAKCQAHCGAACGSASQPAGCAVQM